MSNLKNIVVNALEMKSAGPQIISSVDTLIQRALIDLQRSDVLPSRKWTFTCEDRKEEYRDDDEKIYNFFYLPEDFRKLDEFRPLKTYPYKWTGDEYDLYRDTNDNLSDQQEENLQKKFTITDNNFDTDAKYEKILIARPFPEDTETVQIKYYVNGQSLDYDWVSSDYWEAIINWIYAEVGLVSHEESEDHISRIVGQNKEKSGSLVGHGTRSLSGKFFGARRRDRKRTGRRKYDYYNNW